MNFNSVFQGDDRLLTLRKWLNFELPGSVLFALSFFYNIATTLFVIAVVVFTPYMLYVLTAERRYGWIIFFSLFVVIPSIFSYYFFAKAGLVGGSMLVGAIPMALYLFYCYFLKLAIPGMMDD